MKLFVDLMVAIDYKDAQTNISWVHLAKIFAFVVKENKAFMDAARKDLEEDLAHKLSSTNVWKFFSEENPLYFECVGKVLSKGFQDNQFINCDDRSTTQSSQNSKRNPNNLTKFPKPHGNLLMTKRRVVNYICRAPTHNKGIYHLQTIVILKRLFEIWPNLEFLLQTLFQLSRYLERTKTKTKMRGPAPPILLSEMERKAKETKSDIIYSAMRRTWHGNLLKFPSLRDIDQILSSWRNEEKEKQTTIESFSKEHSYHMERLKEDISGFGNTIEYNIWPKMWNTDGYLLTDAHRDSIVRMGNSEITEHNKNDKQKQNRIRELKTDKSFTLQKLKEMCAAANVTCDGKPSRDDLIKALAEKEFYVPKRATALTGINPYIPLFMYSYYVLASGL